MNNKGNGAVAALVICLVVFLLGILYLIGTYNSLVNADVNVESKWGNVETAYQRRIDLIPNLVATVKGSAEFESNMQTKIAELRSAAKNAKTPGDFQMIDNSVGTTLNLVVESYPQVRSTEAFTTLQSQLEGTENRIKYERDEYNRAVKEYAGKTRRFPTNVLANMFGFDSDKWQMFGAEEGADKAPKVDFNFTN